MISFETRHSQLSSACCTGSSSGRRAGRTSCARPSGRRGSGSRHRPGPRRVRRGAARAAPRRRLPHPRRPDGRAEEVRPARRPEEEPVQQALTELGMRNWDCGLERSTVSISHSTLRIPHSKNHTARCDSGLTAAFGSESTGAWAWSAHSLCPHAPMPPHPASGFAAQVTVVVA